MSSTKIPIIDTDIYQAQAVVNKVPEPPLPQLLLPLVARVLDQLELLPLLLPLQVVPPLVLTERLLPLLSLLVAFLRPLLPQPTELPLLLLPLLAARALERLPLLPLPLVAQALELLLPLLPLPVALLPLLVQTVLLPVETAPLLVAPQELALQEPVLLVPVPQAQPVQLLELVPRLETVPLALLLALLVPLVLPALLVLLPVRLDLLAHLEPRAQVPTAPPTAPPPHLHLATERPQVARAPRLVTPTLLSLILRRRTRSLPRLCSTCRMAMVLGYVDRLLVWQVLNGCVMTGTRSNLDLDVEMTGLGTWRLTIIYRIIKFISREHLCS